MLIYRDGFQITQLSRHITTLSDAFLVRILFDDGLSRRPSHPPPQVEVMVMTPPFAETVVVPLHFN